MVAAACVSNSPWLAPMISLDWTPDETDESARNSPGRSDPADFEFTLSDPVGMLPADELFSDGKLVPLQMAAAARTTPDDSGAEIASLDPAHVERTDEISGKEEQQCLSSPKAPRCSSRWREFLGLRKLQSSTRSESEKSSASTAAASSRTPNPRSIRHFLHRNLKSSPADPSLSLPLLRDSDTDTTTSSSSSRFSLSSKSSSSDSSDLPRLSLDTEKPGQVHVRAGSHPRTGGPTRVRVSRPVRRISADAESPRMNSSGKVVFKGGGSLERSSSSPSSFHGGGARVRPRGMERSYSANVVRVNPVLNVPVCSLRHGSMFGFFSSSSEKVGPGGKNATGGNKKN
ncbi:Uncharacterized protein M6B38_223065 [Iris pallida]|uniref:Uncharacterized protein n=1 Tax=Iris pallida TaxID=29817 RepID=A0AAX6DWV5_IRIPA|nr:Uncharacterized protein M6B38_223065 [Iris pallida]